MNNINELYNLWLEKATADPDLKKELLGIKGNDDEVLDRFYRSLEFGTAGLELLHRRQSNTRPCRFS